MNFLFWTCVFSIFCERNRNTQSTHLRGKIRKHITKIHRTHVQNTYLFQYIRDTKRPHVAAVMRECYLNGVQKILIYLIFRRYFPKTKKNIVENYSFFLRSWRVSWQIRPDERMLKPFQDQILNLLQPTFVSRSLLWQPSRSLIKSVRFGVDLDENYAFFFIHWADQKQRDEDSISPMIRTTDAKFKKNTCFFVFFVNFSPNIVIFCHFFVEI